MRPSTPPDPSSGPPLFGDLLALSRRSWIRQMADGLRAKGYDDYRPSDAAVFRRLLAGPVAVGGLGEVLGVSRQAARKVVEGLEQRSYVSIERDPTDGRRLIVALTPDGKAYAKAVVDVINTLNKSITKQVAPDQLATARAVLLTVISSEASGKDRGRTTLVIDLK